MQKHYINAHDHLVEETSLSFNLQNHLRCFHPKAREQKWSCQDVSEVSKIHRTDVVSEDTLLDEWKLYKLESEITNDENSVNRHMLGLCISDNKQQWRIKNQKYNTVANSAESKLLRFCL